MQEYREEYKKKSKADCKNDYKNDWIPVSTPEEQGIPSIAIVHFMEQIRARDLELHSLQVIRNGSLCINAVAAPYRWDSFHRIFSAAKGIVATAMLFAIQEGYFQMDDPVIPLLPSEWIPDERDERWDRLTVYHLLTMTSGHDCDTFFKMWGKSSCWVKTFFETPPVYEPGTFFCYDMGAQYVMNEIIARQTGLDTGKYLKRRFFDPLGIEYTNNYTEPERLFFSSSIQFQPDALTKISQFYLQKGVWNGEQLLRKDLAEELGAHHCPSFHYDPSGITGQPGGTWEGYGLHMWRMEGGGYAFRGGQGQVGMVLPSENMAVGLMCAAHNHGELVDIFHQTIRGECFKRPLPVDPAASALAKSMLADLNLAPANVSDRSSLAEKYSNVKYEFVPNLVGQKELSFTFETTHVSIHSVSETEEKTVLCGLGGAWPEREQGYIMNRNHPDHISDLDRIFGYDTHKTMYSGGWRSPNVFVFYMRSASLLCDYRYECTFLEDELVVKLSFNTIMPRNKYKDRTKAPDVYIYGRRKGGNEE